MKHIRITVQKILIYIIMTLKHCLNLKLIAKKAIKKILQRFLPKADTKGKIIEPFQELTLILSLSKAL